MRRALLFSLLALLAGAALWHLLQTDTGYVLIVVAGHTLEMRLLFALLVLLGGAALAGWLLRLLAHSIRVLRYGWRFRSARRQKLAAKRTQSGLLHYIEGNWLAAQRDLLKAASDAEQPLVHYLAAARSAYELGQKDRARQYLVKAEQVAPQNELAIALSQARILLLDREYEACLATLHRAKTVAPQHPVVLNLLREVYLKLQDWAALEALLPELADNRILPAESLVLLQEHVYAALLRLAAERPGIAAEKLAELEAVWRRLPKDARQKPSFIALYAQGLLAAGRHQALEELLSQSLRHAWSAPLVELYGLCNTNDPAGQLQKAQGWLRDHPQDAVLHLALGRICLRNQLWGQARDNFLTSLHIQPCPVAYAELARLLAYLGEHKLSTEYYQKGLLLTTQGLPNLPMPGTGRS